MDTDHRFLGSRPSLALPAVQDYDAVIAPATRSAEPPQFTIAIPTYRRPALLRESLASAAGQATRRPYEIVVVDNDSTPEIAAEVDAIVRGVDFPRLSLYRNRANVGMFGNWNRCLGLARAPWISILNDDDLVRPDFVECLAGMVDAEPEADLVQTGYEIWDRRAGGQADEVPPASPRTPAPAAATRPVTLLESVLGNRRAGSLGIAYRLALAREIGGFDAGEYPTADYCFNVRMLVRSRKALESDALLAVYRVEANESLKVETLQGFLRNDLLLRREAARLLGHGALMRAYARHTVVAQRRSLERTWGARIPVEDLGRALGVRFPRTPAGTLLSRLASSALRRVLRRLG